MAVYEGDVNPATYNFRPYQSDIQGLATAITSRTNAWEAQAVQIKDQYQRALNLNLSHNQSKEKLKSFMIEADSKLKELSKTDLSIPGNAKNALDIFTPLYKDKSLMLDDQITTFYNNQNQVAQRARIQDGGKNWSNTNYQYMMEKFNDFITDNDESKWDSHYNQRRAYEPYYDYRQEFQDITKGCRPDSYERTDKNGLYFEVQKQEGVSQSKLEGCLQQGLSDRAKRQLSLEGYMRYGKDYYGTGEAYFNRAQFKAENANKMYSAAQGRIDGLLEKQKKGTLTQQEAVLLESTITERDGYRTQVEDITKDLDAISQWDETFLKDNYDRLASDLFIGSKVTEYARFNAYQEVSNTLEEDNAAMLVLRLNQDTENMKARFQHDQIMEGIRQRNRIDLARARGQIAGDISSYPVASTNTFTENLIRNAEQQYEQDYTDALGTLNSADDYLLRYFKTKYSSDYADINTAEELKNSPHFQEYIKANSDDYGWNKYNSIAQDAERRLARISAIQQSVNEKINAEIGQATLQDLVNMPSVAVSTSSGVVNITPERLRNAMFGIDSELTITQEPFPQRPDQNISVIRLNGQDVSTPELRRLWYSIVNRESANLSRIELKRRELFGQEWQEQMRDLRNIAADNTDKNPTRVRIASNLGLGSSDMAKSVFLQKADPNGNLFFDVIPTEDMTEQVVTQRLGEVYGTENVTTGTDDSGRIQVWLRNAPDYRMDTVDAKFRSDYQYLTDMVRLKQSDIRSGRPFEMPLYSDTDRAGSVPRFKLVVRKGIDITRGGNTSSEMDYFVKRVGPDGRFTGTEVPVMGIEDALQTIKNIDKNRLNAGRY